MNLNSTLHDVESRFLNYKNRMEFVANNQQGIIRFTDSLPQITKTRILNEWGKYWQEIAASLPSLTELYDEHLHLGERPVIITVNHHGDDLKHDGIFCELLFILDTEAETTGPFWVFVFDGVNLNHTQASY